MHLGSGDRDSTFQCSVHGRCQLEEKKNGIASCSSCDKYLPLDASTEQIRERWLDSLRITDSKRQATQALRNLLSDGSAFLVLGGPSSSKEATERLTERGVWSMGVNNVAAHIRTNAFLCSDPPQKFHDGIWRDPSIMKFVPTPKLRGRRAALRRKVDGEFVPAEFTVAQAPNTWGFGRRSWLFPDQSWFLEDSAPWGNHRAGAAKTGQPKVVQTMLLGLRVLQYLGARNIFLLGCDFRMDPRGARYSFDQGKDLGGVQNCNNNYKVLNKWLLELRPVFERFGFHTYNTNQESHLSAFDYVPFDQAVEFCKGDNFPEEPFETKDWYLK